MSREGLNRLVREYSMIQKDPIPFVVTSPAPNNWLSWHFVIYDLPDDSPYYGGVYLGELKFSSNYPMSPPSIIVHTPNGRFEPGVRICTSMSDFHPETWSPIWRVSSILQGLVSFMQSDERSTGCIVTTDAYKRVCAQQSMAHNLKLPRFTSLFESHIPAFQACNARLVIVPDKPGKKPSEGWSLVSVGLAVLLVAVVMFSIR